MLDVLKEQDSQFLQGFETHLNDLKNLYTEVILHNLTLSAHYQS